MHIGIITGHFMPKENAGSVRITSFVDAWKSNPDLKISVFTEKIKDDKSDEDTKYMLDNSNVTIYRVCSTLANNNCGFVRRVLNEIWISILILIKLLCSRDIDMYLVSSPPFFLTVSALLASKYKKVPYILDVRDLYPEVLFEYGALNRNNIIGKLLISLEKHIYNSSYRVTTVTDGLKKNIENKTDKPVFLIQNGVDTKVFFKNRPENRNEYFAILFHGTMGKAQDIDFIINYCRYLKENGIQDIKLWVIGDGPKADILKNAIAEYSLDNILIYYGSKSYKEIPYYINKADLGLSPRIDGLIGQTAFPVKIFEYMSCGLPVVVTPFSEAGKFVEDNGAGYQLKGDDIIGFHKRVTDLKMNKEMYNSVSDRALKASEGFSRYRIAMDMLRIME